MKILILSFYYYPDLCAGSFRCTALVEQLKRLKSTSLEIDVITSLPNRYASFGVQAPEFEHEGCVRIYRIPLPAHHSGMVDQIKAYYAFVKSVQKLIRHKTYDVVFATSSRLMTATFGAAIARQKKCRLYLDIRDLFVDTLTQILPKKLSMVLKPIFLQIERWTFFRAQRINLVSKGFEPYFQKKYPHMPLSFFTNGIDEEFLTMDISVTSAKSINTVLYAGNIGEGQGLHCIIPTLANRMRHKIQFKIIGDGGRKQQLKDMLQAAGCSNVELLPPMTRQELIQHYQQADVLFCHFNTYEAFHKVLPSKIFEYAAMGKPIWAGVAGYSADFIQNEITNAVVFEPCNAIHAENVFESLQLETKQRTDFIEKYARNKIMKAMAGDIILS